MTVIELIDELLDGVATGRFHESDTIHCESGEDAAEATSVFKLNETAVRIG